MTASNKNNIAEPEPGAKIKAKKKGKFRGPVAHNPQGKNPEKKPLPHGEKNSEKNLTKKPAQTKMDTN